MNIHSNDHVIEELPGGQIRIWGSDGGYTQMSIETLSKLVTVKGIGYPGVTIVSASSLEKAQDVADKAIKAGRKAQALAQKPVLQPEPESEVAA